LYRTSGGEKYGNGEGSGAGMAPVASGSTHGMEITPPVSIRHNLREEIAKLQGEISKMERNVKKTNKKKVLDTITDKENWLKGADNLRERATRKMQASERTLDKEEERLKKVYETKKKRIEEDTLRANQRLDDVDKKTEQTEEQLKGCIEEERKMNREADILNAKMTSLKARKEEIEKAVRSNKDESDICMKLLSQYAKKKASLENKLKAEVEKARMAARKNCAEISEDAENKIKEVETRLVVFVEGNAELYKAKNKLKEMKAVLVGLEEDARKIASPPRRKWEFGRNKKKRGINGKHEEIQENSIGCRATKKQRREQ